MKDKEYKVKYLGHSAFIVESKNYYLFFDYVGISEDDGYEIEEQIINFENYEDKTVIMFNSHDHFDHYNKALHLETQKYKNIISILGDIESNLKNTITIKPREIKEIGNIKIYAGASTDLGVCYLIDIDGFVIYYGGDNADWGDGDEANNIHYQEIDYFANLGLKVDLAFIHVCNFSGQRPKDMTNGAIYSIKKLNPRIVFPMHSAGREKLYKNFLTDAINDNCTNKIICMEKMGQIYTGE